MFIVNDKDEVCSTCNIGYLRLDYVSPGLPFWLPTNILDSLVYFGFYEAASRVGTDRVLTAVASKRCTEVDWEGTGTKIGFVR